MHKKRISSLQGLIYLAVILVLQNRAIAQTNAEGESENAAPSGFFDIVFSGGIVGAAFILILLTLSLLAAYLIFDHLMTIRRKDLMPEGLSDQVRQALLA